MLAVPMKNRKKRKQFEDKHLLATRTQHTETGSCFAWNWQKFQVMCQFVFFRLSKSRQQYATKSVYSSTFSNAKSGQKN